MTRWLILTSFILLAGSSCTGHRGRFFSGAQAPDTAFEPGLVPAGTVMPLYNSNAKRSELVQMPETDQAARQVR